MWALSLDSFSRVSLRAIAPSADTGPRALRTSSPACRQVGGVGCHQSSRWPSIFLRPTLACMTPSTEMNVLVMILANEHARHGSLKATCHRCRMAA
jgi:hypothetical protein